MKKILFLILSLLLAPSSIHARSWHLNQGDLLTIDTPIPEGLHDVSVSAFNKKWAFHRQPKSIRAWIGADMDTRPGSYPVLIQGRSADAKRWKQQHEIIVKKSEFRISRIQVKRRMADFDTKSLARLRADQAAIKRTYSMKVVRARPEIHFARMPVKGIISTPFGARRIVNGKPRSPHSGLDIATAEGTPVRLPLAGRVLLAESMFLNGNAVVIGHGNGLVSVYTHLQRLEVRKNQWLQTGDRIGAVGQTGRATGPHLHWGVRYLNARINPLSLIR